MATALSGLSFYYTLMTVRFFITGFLGLCEGEPSLPVWEDSHYVAGTLSLPYAEVNEPFAAYWDIARNRSLINYYGSEICCCFVNHLNKQYPW